MTFGDSVWIRARAAGSKGTVSSVPAWFRADSGTNLIKQGEIVTGRPCGSVAQWSECSQRFWVRVPIGPCAFSSPVTLATNDRSDKMFLKISSRRGCQALPRGYIYV